MWVPSKIKPRILRIGSSGLRVTRECWLGKVGAGRGGGGESLGVGV